jgi:peroxiredoxin Q/BCP
MELEQGENIQEKSFEDMVKESPYTVLYFYPKDDTPGSTIEAINFQQLGTDFAAL